MEEQQIKICIDEMEKLKGKMEALEKQFLIQKCGCRTVIKL